MAEPAASDAPNPEPVPKRRGVAEPGASEGRGRPPADVSGSAPDAVVVLRPLRVEDAARMVEVLADHSLYTFTGGEPPTLAELRLRYGVQTRGHSADGSERWANWIVEWDGAAVGYVQATIPRDGGPAEVAWVIGRPWQGRGYARAAVRALAAELRRGGVAEVIAHIHPDHVASQRVAAAIGLADTGVLADGENRWHGRLDA